MAPKWCSFLDNLTEELEEERNTIIYDDYKFITREDIESLGIKNMIGTPYLKPIMHGFFIGMRLYNKVKAIADPFEYKKYREEKVAQKLEEAPRIRIKKKLPKVNKNLAAQLLEKNKSAELLSDNRFDKMWTEKNFERNEKEQEELYKHITAAKQKQTPIKEAFDMLPEDEESNNSDIEDSDEYIERHSNSDDSSEEKHRKHKEKKLDMYEIKEGYDITDEKKK